MGSFLLLGAVFCASAISTLHAGEYGFTMSFKLPNDNMTYSMTLTKADATKWYDNLCDRSTTSYDFNIIRFNNFGQQTSSKRMYGLSLDPNLYIFSCKHLNQTSFKCTRVLQQSCNAAERYYKFHTTINTSCPYKCIGICYKTYLTTTMGDFSFIETPNKTNCKTLKEKMTTSLDDKTPSQAKSPDVTTSSTPQNDVSVSVPVIIGVVLGSVVTVVVVALVFLVLRRRFYKPVLLPRPSSSVAPTANTIVTETMTASFYDQLTVTLDYTEVYSLPGRSKNLNRMSSYIHPITP